MLRLSFETQKIKENYAILHKKTLRIWNGIFISWEFKNN